MNSKIGIYNWLLGADEHLEKEKFHNMNERLQEIPLKITYVYPKNLNLLSNTNVVKQPPKRNESRTNIMKKLETFKLK